MVDDRESVLIGNVGFNGGARRPRDRGARDQPDAVHRLVSRIVVRFDADIRDDRAASRGKLLLSLQAVAQPGRELGVALTEPAQIGAQPMRQENAALEREPQVQFGERREFRVRGALVIETFPPEIPAAEQPEIHRPRAVFIDQPSRPIRFPPAVVGLENQVALTVVGLEVLRDRDEHREAPGGRQPEPRVDLRPDLLLGRVRGCHPGRRQPEEERCTGRSDPETSRAHGDSGRPVVTTGRPPVA